MSKLHDLADIGQSIWLDYIRRDILRSGELNQLRQTGVRGVTSNPSIFEQAIARSDDYEDDLDRLIAEGRSANEIYETLAIEDIQDACDVFMSLYRQTDGADGYVSLEVDPRLAYDTQATINEAKRLFAAVDRPNVYIKVPATPEGIPAIRELISEGVNVNVTLIFAISAYEEVAEAYIAGLESLVEKGGNPSNVSSVASFFVSRVDSNVDKQLKSLGNASLLGKIGIANAKMAYQRFLQIFSGPRWEKLAARGARVQRPLWGSTSTKDPDYPDTLYVDSLIGPHTVNTVPPETLEAILDHATVARSIDEAPEEAQRQLRELDSLGISLENVTAQLLEEGVDKFAAAFDSLMSAIEERIKEVQRKRTVVEGWRLKAGRREGDVQETVQRLRETRVLERLWEKDYTLWSDRPVEIENRLDWLGIAATMEQQTGQLNEFATELAQAGIRNAIVLGMGGSSLAPELFAKTFGDIGGGITSTVLDSTDPLAISNLRTKLKPQETVFIVSSKSGGTVETISLFKYFYNWISDAMGRDSAGQHFIAITDEGSKLADMAQRYDFRKLFLNNPNIGGRYSALSHFGLVPAALVGVDIAKLLDNAQNVAGPESAETALQLGALMGVMALAGRDKLTLLIPPEIAGFGDWVEQLVAESTGKDGTGILPVVGEPVQAPKDYGDDRLFVYFRLQDNLDMDDAVARLIEAGYPGMTMQLENVYALGEQFVIWEVATAVAGHVMGIHPFNQPNVESAKRRATEMIAAFKETGSLPGGITAVRSGGIDVQELVRPADTAAEALDHFLDSAAPGGYVAVHAYVAPNPATDTALAQLRLFIQERTGLAVTVGYGPRFLHSTGQLHKGDAGRGMFVQLVSEPLNDLPIPDEAGRADSSMTFGILKLAQALGDAQALKEADRPVIRFYFGGDPVTVIARLTGAL